MEFIRKPAWDPEGWDGTCLEKGGDKERLGQQPGQDVAVGCKHKC